MTHETLEQQAERMAQELSEKLVIYREPYFYGNLKAWVETQLQLVRANALTEALGTQFDMRNYEYWTGARWQILSPYTLMMRLKEQQSLPEGKDNR